MERKFFVVLMVFALGLMPFPILEVQAQSTLNHSIDDASVLMYFNDAILLSENELDDSPDISSLPSLVHNIEND